jgi:N-acetylneuraminate synthase
VEKEAVMKISNRNIGPNKPPLIIAEIGINHGDDLNVAKNKVELIATSGCQCVKHQTHIIEDEMTEEAKSIFSPNANKSIWDVIKECSLTLGEEHEFKKYAENLGLISISTPFLRMAADFLDEIDGPALKICSGEVNNLPFITHIAQKAKPTIMSTGMQSIKSLQNSVTILEDAGVEYALLECTNLYPSPPEIVSNKSAIK